MFHVPQKFILYILDICTLHIVYAVDNCQNLALSTMQLDRQQFGRFDLLMKIMRCGNDVKAQKAGKDLWALIILLYCIYCYQKILKIPQKWTSVIKCKFSWLPLHDPPLAARKIWIQLKILSLTFRALQYATVRYNNSVITSTSLTSIGPLKSSSRLTI